MQEILKCFLSHCYSLLFGLNSKFCLLLKFLHNVLCFLHNHHIFLHFFPEIFRVHVTCYFFSTPFQMVCTCNYLSTCVRHIVNGLAEVCNNHTKLKCTMYLVLQCSYINGSPQNTNVPGVVELAKKHGTFIGGDDFKSGQTKIKSVLVDFLVTAGLKVRDLTNLVIKAILFHDLYNVTFFQLSFLALELLANGFILLQPTSIVSYNHLGNNDGKNLSAPKQFRSKEVNIAL